MQPDKEQNPVAQKAADNLASVNQNSNSSTIIQPIPTQQTVESNKTDLPQITKPGSVLEPSNTNLSSQVNQVVTGIQPSQPEASSTSGVFVDTAPITKSSFEQEESKSKKRKWLILSIICLIIILASAGGSYAYWYSKQDHSIYAKLTSYNYNQGNVNISFKYPVILSPDTSELAKVQKENDSSTATYYQVLAYKPNTKQALGIIVSTVQNKELYKLLNINPSQYLLQIKNNSGSWINILKQKDPQGYMSIYNGCDNMITNQQNQTLVSCYQSNNGVSIIRLIGADINNEYDLILAVPNSVWNAHTKVWQEVTKSFTY